MQNKYEDLYKNILVNADKILTDLVNNHKTDIKPEDQLAIKLLEAIQLINKANE